MSIATNNTKNNGIIFESVEPYILNDENLKILEYIESNTIKNKAELFKSKTKKFTIEAIIPKEYQINVKDVFLGSYDIKTSTRQNGIIYKYNKIYRNILGKMFNNPNYYKDEFGSKGKCKTELMKKYNIPGRMMNSILKQVETEVKKHKEARKSLIEIIKNKVDILESDIELLKDRIKELKPYVISGEVKPESKLFKEYTTKKEKKYIKQLKLDRKRQLLKNLNKEVETGVYKYCIGGKNFFKKYRNLELNNYKSHEKWLNEWRSRRNKCVYYLGSGDEPSGNGMSQLTYESDTNSYTLKIRDIRDYSAKNKKYINVKGIKFKYLNNKLIEQLVKIKEYKQNIPITTRIKVNRNKVYIQVILTYENTKDTYITSKENGVISIDYNEGFYSISNLDKNGKLLGKYEYKVRDNENNNKTSNYNKDKTLKAVNDIVNKAIELGKDLVIEDLDFVTKKSKLEKGYNKERNRKLHSLDYSRYIKALENITYRNKVRLVKVEAYNTSIEGEKRYSKLYGITRHESASLYIGTIWLSK